MFREEKPVWCSQGNLRQQVAGDKDRKVAGVRAAEPGGRGVSDTSEQEEFLAGNVYKALLCLLG